MRRNRSVKLLQGIGALLAASCAGASPVIADASRWQIASDPELAELRGGFDLGALVANFAIQRVVEIDGVVVARMQIVISNLDNIGKGEAPTVTLSGPVAQLVQVMNASGAAAAARAAQASGANGVPPGLASNTSPALTATVSGSGLVTNGRQTPATVSSGINGGSVAGTGTGSGSTASFGSAINTAVAVATAPVPATASSSATNAPGSSGTGAGAAPAPAPVVASGSAPPSVAQAGAGNGVVAPGTPVIALPVSGSTDAGSSSTRTVPLGNGGQVVVLSNLPNATAITTAVQNQVRAATIQTQTIISATVSSLSSLNGLNLAGQIRQQVAATP